jgi:hypothetical protein
VDDHRRPGIAAGVLLVLFGVALLALQLVPGLRVWLDISFGWPSIIIGIGAVMLFAGLFTWQPGLVNGGCIVAGIGGILYWQNATNTWASWAYAWTLIPAFAGVGMILAGVMQGDFLRSLRMGLWQILTSAGRCLSSVWASSCSSSLFCANGRAHLGACLNSGGFGSIEHLQRAS